MTSLSRHDQLAIRCVLMRSGTSKGLYFHEADLPKPGRSRDLLLSRLMGSPDVLQIDGLGGSRPITSKVAIVATSDRPDADIDYTFSQIAIDSTHVGHSSTCGNISAGVGPFAIDEGLIEAIEPFTRVRIYNTDTDAVYVADVPVENGRVKVSGAYAIAGVPGTGAEVRMNWTNSVGATFGRLLPTGNSVDAITLESGAAIRVTFCDAANPVLWVDGADLGSAYDATATDPYETGALRQTIRELRGKAAVRSGLLDDWRDIDTTNIVKLFGIVSPPTTYATLNGDKAEAQHMDIRVHVLFMDRLHPSVPGSGSISLAAASRIRGSVVHSVATNTDSHELRIGHASGIVSTRVQAHPIEAEPYVAFDELGFSRTVRRLMDGNAYYPRTTTDILGENK